MSNTTNQQCNFNNPNEKSSPIVRAIQILVDIQQPIKNKYVALDDLTTYIEKTENLLKLAIELRNFLLTNTQPSLDVIFPAMDHLKLFIPDIDKGAIALVSKTLHKLMVLHFGESNVDIFIAKHYIDNDAYDYFVDVNFHTMVPKDINIKNHIQQFTKLPKGITPDNYGQQYGVLPNGVIRRYYLEKHGKLPKDITPENEHFIEENYIKGKFPLKVKTIALKRLRKLIGQELYFSEHKIVFSKEDIMYLYLKYKELISDYSKICMFCYNSSSYCYNRKLCHLEFVHKEGIKILFNEHIKNETYDKEFKYFLHHIKTDIFTNDVIENNNCQFCSNPNDELCAVIYKDINDDNYFLKDCYKNFFNMYHRQLIMEAGMQDILNQFHRAGVPKEDKVMKSYSFCIHPEYEYIYDRSKV